MAMSVARQRLDVSRSEQGELGLNAFPAITPFQNKTLKERPDPDLHFGPVPKLRASARRCETLGYA